MLNFSLGIEVSDHAQLKYLLLRADSLTEREKFVVLQIDEMHVAQGFNYKGGQIIGVAHNSSNEQANAVQAFLISSIAGRMREIVALVPVKQSTSSLLSQMIIKAIEVIQLCGFVVGVVASDNNHVNVKTFEELCGGEGNMISGILNPKFPQYRIFFIFDTVHILKSIRNNWLNQKDSARTFVYPQPVPTYSGKSSEVANSSSLMPPNSVSLSCLSTTNYPNFDSKASVVSSLSGIVFVSSTNLQPGRASVA